MVCEITPEMVERFLAETNDEFGLFVGMKKSGDRAMLAFGLQGEPFDLASAEIACAAAVALYVGFSTMLVRAHGVEPPKGLPLDKLSAASERLAEIATRRLEDAIRKFSKKP